MNERLSNVFIGILHHIFYNLLIVRECMTFQRHFQDINATIGILRFPVRFAAEKFCHLPGFATCKGFPGHSSVH